MNEVKALILCNNPIAIPGIKEFLFYGKVAAIATTSRNKEMQHILDQLLRDTGVLLLLLNKRDYKIQLTEAVKQYNITVGLLMTFPFIITPEILSLPVKGFINFHYGLLPACRGPQPILRHLLNNDKEAGVTVHIVDQGIDTGPVIMQEKIAIEDSDTYGILQSKLAFLAAKQAATLLKILSYGTVIPAAPQDESKAAYYEMPVAKNLTIDWKGMSAAVIVRLVNACNPWNKGAGTAINGWVVGITEAEILGDNSSAAMTAGTIIECNKENGLTVATADDKILKINIVYTNEGFFSGSRLASFGVKAGMQFS
ncbi:MAG: formyltransferase family protein [Chitinophagaceae bacterium]